MGYSIMRKMKNMVERSLWYENYLNAKGRPGDLLLEPGGGVEGNSEKGKLGGCFCPLTLGGGGPQSNVASAWEGALSPSGFFDDQADFAWCFALRFPPLRLNGEEEAVVGKAAGNRGWGVAGVPLVEPEGSPPSFWGVLNSTRVLVAAEPFALRRGLSRIPNRTIFNL